MIKSSLLPQVGRLYKVTKEIDYYGKEDRTLINVGVVVMVVKVESPEVIFGQNSIRRNSAAWNEFMKYDYMVVTLLHEDREHQIMIEPEEFKLSLREIG